MGVTPQSHGLGVFGVSQVLPAGLDEMVETGMQSVRAPEPGGKVEAVLEGFVVAHNFQSMWARAGHVDISAGRAAGLQDMILHQDYTIPGLGDQRDQGLPPAALDVPKCRWRNAEGLLQDLLVQFNLAGVIPIVAGVQHVLSVSAAEQFELPLGQAVPHQF